MPGSRVRRRMRVIYSTAPYLNCRFTQPVARGQHAARGEIFNHKTSVYPPLDESETERRSNFKNLPAIYLTRHVTLLITF